MVKRLGLLIIAAQVSLYGIVSVTPVEPNTSSGFSGEVDGSFKETTGNTKRKDYSGGAKLQYDYTDRVDYILTNFLYAKEEDQKVEDKSFVHARHLEALSDGLVGEIYLQSEQNEFLNLTRRELAGAGVRVRLFNGKSIRLYLGTGAYASEEIYETDTGSELYEYMNRANIYLSYTQKIDQTFDATMTAYYQPAFEDSTDYYLMANGSVRLFITQKFHAKLSAGIKEDSEPFEGNKKSDAYYILGFGYAF